MKKLEGYTPGPWELALIENEQWEVSPVRQSHWIVRTGCLAVSPEENKANAALIAQAPTLLEQRDKVVSQLREMRRDMLDSIDGGEECRGRDGQLSRWIDEAERVLREVGDGD